MVQDAPSHAGVRADPLATAGDGPAATRCRHRTGSALVTSFVVTPRWVSRRRDQLSALSSAESCAGDTVELH
jgi:hypothetical protein